MSRVDTTSFAEILTRSLGQGANMAQNAASLQQRRKEAEAQQAFQQQQFAANEAQRAFGNDMQTQRLGLDQLQFQTMTDRIAQEQAAEQEDRLMGATLLETSGLGNRYLQAKARQNGGVIPPDAILRMRKWQTEGIRTSALQGLQQAFSSNEGIEAAEKASERFRSVIGSMRNDPKNAGKEPLFDLLDAMAIDPQTRRKAMEEAYSFNQQQQAAQQAAAEQQQRLQLAGVLTGGGQLTPEQSLIVMDDPALRRMQEQRNQPAPPDPQVVAQLFTQANQGDTAARAQLIQMGQLTPSAAFGGQQTDQTGFLRKQVDDRKAEYDFAMERAKAAGLWTKGTPESPAKIKPASAIPNDPSDPQRQAYAALIQAERGLERSMSDLRNAGRNQQPQQQGPVLLSELDAQQGLSQVNPQTAQTYSAVKSQLTAQLGRPPTPDEMRAAMRQQLGQPPPMPR
jgi:hypothetical protein